MIKFTLQKTLQSANGQMELSVKGEIPKGQFTTIYGVSGAGKTSVLRMLAGLLTPEKGYIEVNGQVWLDTNRKINLPTQQRNIGYVFQEYALFPNMTVLQNLQYALPKNALKQRIDELLDIADLMALKDRKPNTLSGGQQQRVALVRALVRQPDILLLDEPLSALDETMRIRLQDYIIELHQSFGLTTILVSHDLAEIYKMSEQIWILKDGQITASGTPNQVFTKGQMSGKYQTIGSVVNIEKNGVVFIVSVLVGQQVIKVIATTKEIENIQRNDKVAVISKAFNPILMKIEY